MEYGLIGEHLTHSFSKQIHEYVGHYSYDLKEIAKDDLAAFLTHRNFKAINVTIPYKETVIPYLDDISEEAKHIHAVNVIVNKNGKLIGHNTDILGFVALIKHLGLSLKDKNILILGNGGASKAVEEGCYILECKSVIKASMFNEEGTISYQDIYSHQEISIIVNATPVGMFPNNEDILIDIEKFQHLEGFVDVIYNPIRTKTILKAQDQHLKAEGGLYMLVAQAILAMEIFLDKKIDEAVIEQTFKKVLNENSNIVLIGMPSSGKTTLGKLLADNLEMSFVDTDEEIIKKINMPIKDYFAQKGEPSFRDVESEVVNQLYKKTHQVIATGGGIILRKENIEKLKQNGRLIFLDRSLENLITSDDRPLSSNVEALKKLYDSRIELYKQYADNVVDDNDNIDAVLKKIMEICL